MKIRDKYGLRRLTKNTHKHPRKGAFMIEYLNPALALFSIALGLVGWMAPRYTMDTLNIRETTSTMGLSEVRAASGALFVGLGVGALWLGTPHAYLMMGMAWGFAGIGRLTSLILDGQSHKKWTFFAVEVSFAALIFWLNPL
jgi:hypothetical protein